MTPEVDRLVAQYRGRRTIAAELVREIEAAVRHDLDTAAAQHTGEINSLRAEQERERARLERHVEDWREHYRKADAALKAYREQQTNLRESRETIDDGTLVRIQAPRFSSYGDRTVPRPWTLEEVETIVHRLRMAGAVDDTEVRFKHEHTEATVPFPEFALELAPHPAGLAERGSSAAERSDQPPRWLVAVNAVLASPVTVWGLVLIVVAIVVGVVAW